MRLRLRQHKRVVMGLSEVAGEALFAPFLTVDFLKHRCN